MTGVTDSIYDTWHAAVDDHRPVALVTVVEGPGTGAKLLVGEGIDTMGSLGNDDLVRATHVFGDKTVEVKFEMAIGFQTTVTGRTDG